ncbi:MAG: hypothetical protein ABSD47_02330, partial [Candidatus Methylomirabilota bacterium]
MVAILVVFTIILFIAADLVVQWVRARRAKPALASSPKAAGVTDLLVPSLQLERFSLPGGLFFYRGHTWANLLFSGQVKVGVDDFIQLGYLVNSSDYYMLWPPQASKSSKSSSVAMGRVAVRAFPGT